MRSMNTHLLIFLLLQTHLAISTSSPNPGLDLLSTGEIRVCAGKIGKCDGVASVAQEEEFEMDSEVSRRLLMMQRRYISYETLKRDAVPCSMPGASYYNCQSASANRYGRGCEVITRCARSISD